MWQTLVVVLVLAAVLVYLIRHYAGVFRGETSGCSSCRDSSCCSQRKDLTQGDLSGTFPGTLSVREHCDCSAGDALDTGKNGGPCDCSPGSAISEKECPK